MNGETRIQLLHAVLLVILFHTSVAHDCWHYPSIETKEEYAEFVQDCEGEGKLGFENDHPWIFNASMVTEKQFNKLFKKAYRLRMSIFIQNTDFKKPNLKALKKIHVRKGIPSFRIENNPKLDELRAPEKPIESRPKDAPIELYYYANGRGADRHAEDADPFAHIKTLCNNDATCHYAKDTECSRIEDPIKDVDEFFHKCEGAPVIKAIPGVTLELNLAKLSSRQIKKLFENATDVFMCLTAVGTYHRKIRFPRLVHTESCEGGDHALHLENNPFLEKVLLPCRFTSDKSFRIRGNQVLDSTNIMSLIELCLECDIQYPGEQPVLSPQDFRSGCEHFIPPKTKEDYQHLVIVCSGVKKLEFDIPNGKLEFFDASKLSQSEFEELFKKIEEINFGINVVGTDYTRLYLPNLKKIFAGASGTVLKVENNPNMEHLIVHYNVEALGGGKYDAKLADNRRVTTTFLSKWKRRICAHIKCDMKQYVDCSNLDESMSAKEIAQSCSGKKVLKAGFGGALRIDLGDLTQEQVYDLFEHVEEVYACIKARKTSLEELHFTSLKKLVTCSKGEHALVVEKNKKLTTLKINKKAKIEGTGSVKDNPNLSSYDVKRLTKICKECKTK